MAYLADTVIDFHSGYENYKCTVDSQDVTLCWEYAIGKPAPVPSAFTDLAKILMDENNWYMPINCEDALNLYLDLLNCIH